MAVGTHLQFACWRLDGRAAAAGLLVPVALMLLVGRGNDVQIIRSMRLLALCIGAVTVVSFDDQASAVTSTVPTPHWCRQGAVAVVLLLGCASFWAAAAVIATALGDAVPTLDLTVTAGVLFLCGCLIGVVTARHLGRPAGPWTAVAILVVVVLASVLAWRPLSEVDPSEPAWEHAHSTLRWVAVLLAATLVASLSAPDRHRRSMWRTLTTGGPT